MKGDLPFRGEEKEDYTQSNGSPTSFNHSSLLFISKPSLFRTREESLQHFQRNNNGQGAKSKYQVEGKKVKQIKQGFAKALRSRILRLR